MKKIGKKSNSFYSLLKCHPCSSSLLFLKSDLDKDTLTPTALKVYPKLRSPAGSMDFLSWIKLNPKLLIT